MADKRSRLVQFTSVATYVGDWVVMVYPRREVVGVRHRDDPPGLRWSVSPHGEAGSASGVPDEMREEAKRQLKDRWWERPPPEDRP